MPAQALHTVNTIKRTNARRRSQRSKDEIQRRYNKARTETNLLTNPRVFDAESIYSTDSNDNESVQLKLETKYPALMSVLSPALKEAIVGEETYRRTHAPVASSRKPLPARYEGRGNRQV